MKVYLHGDDLASTECITRAMLNRWAAGCLDSFSVMANGEAAQATRTALEASPGRPARVVAHLNLSEGPSSASPDDVTLLVDDEGKLRHGFGSLALLWMKSSAVRREILLGQVEREWRAQIRVVIDMVAPRPVVGVDGHVHLHMLPFLFPVAARLAREFGIPEIRVSREPFYLERGWRDLFALPMLTNLVKHLVLRWCSRSAGKVVEQASLRAPDYVVGIMYTGFMTASTAMAGVSAAERRGAESVEVLFHVGRASEQERARWGTRQEFAAFPCDARRDKEFSEVAVCHERLRERGLRGT